MSFGGHSRGEMRDTAQLLHMLERIAVALERMADADEKEADHEPDA